MRAAHTSVLLPEALPVHTRRVLKVLITDLWPSEKDTLADTFVLGSW